MPELFFFLLSPFDFVERLKPTARNEAHQTLEKFFTQTHTSHISHIYLFKRYANYAQK